MKITAQGANRVVYTHTIVDRQVQDAHVSDQKVGFRLISAMDPGIGSGQYTLYFEFTKPEIDILFETAMQIKLNKKISDLESEISNLHDALKRAGTT